MTNRGIRALILCAVLTLAGASAPTPARAQGPETWTNVSRSEGPSTIPAAVYDAAGALHVVWADDPDAPGAFAQHVYYSRSTDGGATFSAPQRIAGDARARGDVSEIRLATSPSGAIAVAWWDMVPDANGDNDKTAFLALSAGNGDDFGPAVATSISFPAKIPAGKLGFYNSTSLSVAFARDGERVYLLATVMDYRFGGNVYFAKTTGDGGFTRPKRVSPYTVVIPRATSSAMAVLPSGAIWASWTEGHGDFFDEIKDVFYVTSTDGGNTFSAPARAGGAKGVVGTAIPLGGNKLGLLTQIQPGQFKKIKTNFYTSTDGGRTFARRARVYITSGHDQLHQNSAVASADGSTIAVAWVENAPRLYGFFGLWIAVSHDGGVSFDDPVLLDARNYLDPPSAVLAPDGTIGVATSTPDASLADREVVFARVAP